MVVSLAKEKKGRFIVIISSFILFFAGACSTGNKAVGPAGVAPIPDSQYRSLIQKFTHSHQAYQGFYNTFDITATLLNAEVRSVQLVRQAHYLGWSHEQLRQEREKSIQDMSSYTRFFLSFYSPESDHDDLHRPQSIWRVYLDWEGQRYEGQIEKVTRKLVELRNLYPHFNRFHSAYEVSFAVPMSAVEGSSVRLVLTSSVGTAELEY